MTKKQYVEEVHKELYKRGVSIDEIPIVLGKTRFSTAIERCPAKHLPQNIEGVVDRLLIMAAVWQKDDKLLKETMRLLEILPRKDLKKVNSIIRKTLKKRS